VKKLLIHITLASLSSDRIVSTLAESNNQISNNLAFQCWNRYTGEDDSSYILALDPANSDLCQIKASVNMSQRDRIALIGKGLHQPIYKGIQSMLTWLSGQPMIGQQPLFRSTKELELLKATIALFGGAFGSSWIFNSLSIEFYFLLLPFCLLTVGGARRFQVCIMHRCVHYQLWGDKRDRILTEIVSTILLLQNFDSYYYDHIRAHHHISRFANFKSDPDAKLMLLLGFQPGLKS